MEKYDVSKSEAFTLMAEKVKQRPRYETKNYYSEIFLRIMHPFVDLRGITYEAANNAIN